MTPRFPFIHKPSDLPAGVDLTVPLNSLVESSIKYALSFGNNPLKVSDDPVGNSKEEVAVRTLSFIFRGLNNNTYIINSYNTSAHFTPANVSYDGDRQVLEYLENQEPIKLSSLLLLLSVYKHLSLSAKEKYRLALLGSNSASLYYHNNSLYSRICLYLETQYLNLNLSIEDKERATPSYYANHSTVHQLWEPLERWLVNDMPFEKLAQLIVGSGLVTLYPLSHGRAMRLLDNFGNASFLNLMVKPEITEEFVSDILSIPASCTYLAQYVPNTTPKLLGNLAPARATVVRKQFKRFNKIRTQKIMYMCYLFDDVEEFSTDIMSVEFEARDKPELAAAVARYNNWKSQAYTIQNMRLGITEKIPAFKYFDYCTRYREIQAKYNDFERFERETAPAVAISTALRSLYTYTHNYAILESHMREYR